LPWQVGGARVRPGVPDTTQRVQPTWPERAGKRPEGDVSSDVDVEATARGLGGPTTSGISRREVLKKGALVGGAVVWAVPAVEIVGTRVAAATTTSGPTSSNSCSMTFNGLSTFVPTSGTTTVTITYGPYTDPEAYTETLTITPEGTVSDSTKGPNLTFTLSNSGTQLNSSIPNKLLEVKVQVKVTSPKYSNSNTGIFGNCETFTMIAS